MGLVYQDDVVYQDDDVDVYFVVDDVVYFCSAVDVLLNVRSDDVVHDGQLGVDDMRMLIPDAILTSDVVVHIFVL